VRLDLGPSCRVVIRPSGTEPKLKIYVDLAGEAGATGAREQLVDRASAIAEAVAAYLGLA
jgi:phosphomannomutase